MHLQTLKNQVDQRIEFKKCQNDYRRQRINLINTIIESISFEKN